MLGKVLFVIHDLFQDDIYLPLGPAYLAAVLRQAGAEVEIYDMQAHHYTNEQLAEHLDNNEYSMICLGFLAARYSTVHPLLDVIGDHKKSSLLIVGGHGPSPIPSFILENNPAVDVVCIGESEDTIVDLFNYKTKANPFLLKSITGIVYRGWVNQIIYTGSRKPVQDLNSIPFPAWDLFPMDIYSNALHLWGQEKGDRCIGFLSSRGCVGQCSFCHRLEGHGVRFRSAKNVVDEMEFLWTEYNINGYFLYDEMFVASEDRLRKIKQELEDRCLQIKFSANARVDNLNREKMALLKEIGCTFLNFGVESSNQHVLDLMNKKTTVEENIQAIELANEFNINTGINMLWNCPGDTAETLQANIEFLKTHQDHSQLRTVRPLCPYPGSPLYCQSVHEGKLMGPAEFFELFNNSDLITVSFLDGIPDNEAYKMLFKANSELIHDYQHHTDMTQDEADRLIEDFGRLYFEGNFEGNISFKGARHYKKQEAVI